MTIKQQTPKDKTWTDAKGAAIPYSRTTKQERLQERAAHKLLDTALKLEQALKSYRVMVQLTHEDVVAEFDKANDAEVAQTKGNKVWYNFDRSIMVECDVQDRIEFEGLMITAAREKLNEYLHAKLNSEDEFLVEMVTKAFETTNGKLDSKRVMQLVGYKHKIKARLFQEAVELIEKSITRTSSKTYFRVGTRDADGKYQTVQLNFSAV